MEFAALNHENLKEYYGKILAGSKDLKTNACCCADDALSPAVRKALSLIDDEILSKFYGCGSPLPPLLQGSAVLDLGCGTGRDAYVASRLVGPDGFIIGVDMTDEQLKVARRHVESQMKRFGYEKANVEFREGYIEDLSGIGIEDNSVDLVISNCVINLSADKPSVFREAHRVLVQGGRFAVSDVIAKRSLTEEETADMASWTGCIAGALTEDDYRDGLTKAGFKDVTVDVTHEVAPQAVSAIIRATA